METPIFLAVLAAVVLVLLYTIRREFRKDPDLTLLAVQPKVAAPPAPVEAAPPVPVEPKREEPPPLPNPAPPASVPQTVMMEVATKPRVKRVRAPELAAEASKTSATPVETVLGMLKQRDSLAVAFLLREIFDAPVSRRRRR